MKFVHICQRDDPDTGGSLRVAEALAHEQTLAGHEVWLLFLYGPPAKVSSRFEGRVICLGLQSSSQALRGIFLLARDILGLRPDIIHSHDGIIWPRLVFMFCRIPLITHSHLPIRETDSKVGRFLIKKTTRLLLGISLHTIRSWVGDKYPPSKIHYVANGVDFERFHFPDTAEKKATRQELGLPTDKRILLWVGRLHQGMKGSDRVERVAGLLPDDMVLVVVGNGPEFDGMNERCRALIDAGRLIMIGSADAPEVYYQAADRFLFTSYHEPFGLVILEAVASGLPIIAFPVTDGGGAVCLLKEFNALMVDDALADAEIAATLEPNDEYGELTLSNRETALQKYSWRAISEEVVDVYNIALKGRV